jgi:hypothetical protein
MVTRTVQYWLIMDKYGGWGLPGFAKLYSKLMRASYNWQPPNLSTPCHPRHFQGESMEAVAHFLVISGLCMQLATFTS